MQPRQENEQRPVRIMVHEQGQAMKGNGIYASGPKRTAMAKSRAGQGSRSNVWHLPILHSEAPKLLGASVSFKVGRRECREGGWSARGVLWRAEHPGQAAVEVQMILRERELQAVRMRALPQLPTSTCIWLCTDCRTREAWCLAGTWRTPNDAASGERGAGQHRDHCGEFQYSNIQLPVSAAWCTRLTLTS